MKSGDTTFDSADVQAVRNYCISSSPSTVPYRDVDILISSQWPYGVKNDFNDDGSTSKLVAWLAREIKPRYHFAAMRNENYVRQRYLNSASSSCELSLASKFVGLAGYNNSEKQRSVYGVNVAPVDEISLAELSYKTGDETPCPYDGMQLIENDIGVIRWMPTVDLLELYTNDIIDECAARDGDFRDEGPDSDDEEAEMIIRGEEESLFERLEEISRGEWY